MMPPLLLANLFSTYGLAAALAVACLFLLRNNWQRQARSRQATPDPEQIKQAVASPSPPEHVHDTHQDILGWEIEFHELARDTKAEIDTKLVALQSLMIVANEHCQRLEALIAQAENTQAAKTFAPARVSISDSSLGGRAVLDRIADGERDLRAMPSPPRKDVLSPIQAARVNDLARQERSPLQIAREVGATLGDIELYLSLHQDIFSNRSD